MEGAPSPHRRVFWEYAGQLAAREGRWKLVLDGKLDFGRPAADPVHLADLGQDPGERINLRDRHPDIVAELAAAARAWLAEVTRERPAGGAPAIRPAAVGEER